MGLIQNQLQYVVVQPVQDDEDFSKEITVSFHEMFPIVLWNNFAAAGNATTPVFNVADFGSVGFFFLVSAATTIEIQVQTLQSLDNTGWTTYDTVVFTAAGSQFYSLWIFPFENIRFLTTQAVTATIQVFLRT